ncbi:MAG: hypothetical protein VR71_18225 [Roseovarius sp. BRH_c41]|uniref:hypothetical protein n=1 Tax=Roseovarius sp. BRH_c41 TaxID=1629709 RepID=UPI0005F24AA1|nr:hypothetical protein [Roseovarius sp. BRH_c41]KJS41582.1 MAG: hypothetical protein VR71_18225 [Roseovarius sp. BRH_c41]
MRHVCLTFAAVLIAGPLLAHEPEILGVRVEKSGTGLQVAVTLMHPDTGWDHYVDGWEVLDAEGNRLGYRLLHHPHVEEQPFTRSLNDLALPDGAQEIFVRAHCSVDGWNSEVFRVALEP